MAKSPAFRFYPSDFMGSPDVQSMELAEVGAYTFLLCVAWQQDRHGTLPDDDSRLRRWARMNVDQWRESRDLILSKFPVIEDGLRGNKRMMDESGKQKRFSESQKKKVENRWKNRGNTETIPGYEVEDTRALPSVSASVSNLKKPSRAKAASAHPLYKELQGRIFDYYRSKNEGHEPEWNGREGKELSSLLSSRPNEDISYWNSCLNGRYHSDVNHSDRPGLWIARLSSFKNPINGFNRPKENSTPKLVLTDPRSVNVR